jgi:hypothetical protein
LKWSRVLLPGSFFTTVLTYNLISAEPAQVNRSKIKRYRNLLTAVIVSGAIVHFDRGPEAERKPGSSTVLPPSHLTCRFRPAGDFIWPLCARNRWWARHAGRIIVRASVMLRINARQLIEEDSAQRWWLYDVRMDPLQQVLLMSFRSWKFNPCFSYSLINRRGIHWC